MSTGAIEVSEEDKRRHRQVEKDLKEVSVPSAGWNSLLTRPHQAKVKMASQVKVYFQSAPDSM